MGFCNQLLKPALLNILDCISDFKVWHKKEKKNSILSRLIANLCDLLKLTNYLFEIKLTFVPISPATTAGRFPPPYVRNLMQQSEKWHKMEKWSRPFFPDYSSMRFLCQSVPFLSSIRRGERGYLGKGAKLDNVFFYMLTIKKEKSA